MLHMYTGNIVKHKVSDTHRVTHTEWHTESETHRVTWINSVGSKIWLLAKKTMWWMRDKILSGNWISIVRFSAHSGMTKTVSWVGGQAGQMWAWLDIPHMVHQPDNIPHMSEQFAKKNILLVFLDKEATKIQILWKSISKLRLDQAQLDWVYPTRRTNRNKAVKQDCCDSFVDKFEINVLYS